MTKIEHLENIALEEDIHIYDFPFSKDKKATCYLEPGGLKAILMDEAKIASQAERVMVLAEEIGHFATDAVYVIEATANTGAARSSRAKYEAQAARWATRKVLPAKEILDCWGKGITDPWEMSEELSFDRDYIDRAVRFYRSTGELPQDWEMEGVV